MVVILYDILQFFIFFITTIMTTQEQQLGTVKWFDTTKGYGFIQPDNGSKDVFVHISAVSAAGMRTLTEGQKVSFSFATDPKNGKQSATDLKAA